MRRFRVAAGLRAALFAGAVLASVSLAGAGESYKIDPVHSTVVFGIDHFGVSKFYGRLNDVSGSFVVDQANPSASSVELTIKSDSVDTNSAKRDGHIKSPDFFNAKQFPVIKFTSSSISADGDRWKIRGKLDFHGVTKEIEIDFHRMGTAKDPWGNTRTGGTAKFTLKRSDFGMDFMQGPLGDEIELIVSIEGIRS